MTLRPSILYTIKETKVMAGDYYQLASARLSPIWRSPEEAFAPVEEVRHVVPFHHIRRCHRVSPLDSCADGWMDPLTGHRIIEEDCFFAMEPALQSMLETPFTERAQRAERKAEDAERRTTEAVRLLQDANEWMYQFKSLPWWKRAWVAARMT